MYTQIIICCILVTVGSSEDSRPIVKTPLGLIKGYPGKSFNGRPISLFQGIRYAQPPVGNLRFKEPKPFGPWKGIWDAKKSQACLQASFISEDIIGDEDCLFLNVYVPRKQPNPKEKLDVIVEVHGGGFMIGSAQDFVTPTYIMDRDIILVSMNYRLNILGFLYTEDDTIPGNLGLRDQSLALKWIKENIASFGGNPDSVTLQGHSAGSSSVHLHYFSPLSRGLFHRGISNSGTALNVIALQRNPIDKAQRLARSLDCPDSPNEDLVDCLRQIPGHNLVEKVHTFYGCFNFPLAMFAPVIEKNKQNAFLDEHPYYKLKNDEIADVPWLTSNVMHEGVLVGIFPREDVVQQIDEKWDECAKYLLDFNYTLSKSLHVSEGRKIKEFYIGKDQKFKDNQIDRLIQMVSDRILMVDGELAIRTQAKVNKSPVYYFYFTYLGDHFEKCCHGCDYQFFFKTAFLNMNLTEKELEMKDRMIDMTVSFAKTGKPEIGFEWKPTGYQQLTYLNVSDPNKMDLITVDEFSPMKFWHSLAFLENQNLYPNKEEL